MSRAELSEHVSARCRLVGSLDHLVSAAKWRWHGRYGSRVPLVVKPQT